MFKYRSLIYVIFVLGCCFFLLRYGSVFREKKQNYIIKMSFSKDPATLDPRAGSELMSSTLHFMLYEGLMRLNPDGSLTPAQAESVHLSQDRKTYTFILRPTYWSNGKRVMAFDFEYAWKKILTPSFASANCHLFYPILNAKQAKKGEVPLNEVGIKAIDDKTLIITLEKPTPYFLRLISFCVFFPVPHDLDETHPNWHQRHTIISNGPFILNSWKYNNELILKKNPYYWEESSIEMETIFIMIIPNEMTALQMYEKKELDLIGMPYSPLPAEAYFLYHKKGLLQTHPFPSTSLLFFNVRKFPLNNRNIRKALNLAMNRKEIIEHLIPQDQVALNMIPPCIHVGEIVPYFLDHNKTEAKRLFSLGLEELGITFEQFPTLLYSYGNSTINDQIAQVIQHQLYDTLGITIELQSCERKWMLDQLEKRNFEIVQTYWIAQYNDPMSILERFQYESNPKNYCGWENPLYMTLLEKSFYDLTEQERQITLHKAESLILYDMPFAPIYHSSACFMIQNHLSCEDLSPQGAFDITRLHFKTKPLMQGPSFKR